MIASPTKFFLRHAFLKKRIIQWHLVGEGQDEILILGADKMVKHNSVFKSHFYSQG